MMYTTTYSKTITENNQTWFTDDSANDISINGTINSISDVKIVGASGSRTETLDQSQTSSNGSLTYVNLGQTITPSAACIANGLDSIELYTAGITSGGALTMTLYDSPAKCTLIASDVLQVWGGSPARWLKWWFGVEIEGQFYLELSGSSPVVTFEHYTASDLYSTGSEYVSGSIQTGKDLKFKTNYIIRDDVEGPNIYNTSDTGTQISVANDIINTAEHVINSDDTGNITVGDDFSTNKYTTMMHSGRFLTRDIINEELDLYHGAYIVYHIDTKYPITGIPLLTAQVALTLGTATLQISTDGGVWYSNDETLVDDVSTIYNLDNSTSLSFDGQTHLYFRIINNIVTNTSILKSWTLNINIDTTTAQNPYIFYDTVNTFKCDQDVESGINCTIELISEESILQPITIF